MTDKKPVHIHILGKKYRLGTKPGNYLGTVDFDKRRIDILPDYGEDESLDCIVHEVIHVIDFHLNIKLSEHKIKLLEAGFMDFLANNGISLGPLKTKLRRSRK